MACHIQKQEIGDEFHYIIECPFFKCKRKLVIKQKYIQNPNMKQLKNLMTSKNRKELTNICKLIKEIYNGVCVYTTLRNVSPSVYGLYITFILISHCKLQYGIEMCKVMKQYIQYLHNKWNIHSLNVKENYYLNKSIYRTRI
jgi:hypothetical protein